MLDIGQNFDKCGPRNTNLQPLYNGTLFILYKKIEQLEIESALKEC